MGARDVGERLAAILPGLKHAVTAGEAGDAAHRLGGADGAKERAELGRWSDVAAGPDATAETVPGFAMAPWIGIIVPARTPKDIVGRLAQETLAVMRDPEVVKLLTDQQVTPMATGPDEFEQLIKSDLERWANVIRSAGIRAE